MLIFLDQYGFMMVSGALLCVLIATSIALLPVITKARIENGRARLESELSTSGQVVAQHLRDESIKTEFLQKYIERLEKTIEDHEKKINKLVEDAKSNEKESDDSKEKAKRENEVLRREVEALKQLRKTDNERILDYQNLNEALDSKIVQLSARVTELELWKSEALSIFDPWLGGVVEVLTPKDSEKLAKAINELAKGIMKDDTV